MLDCACTKETLCTNCTHRDVCIYKTDYLDILKAVSNASVMRDTPDGKMMSKKVICYDFIGDISVSCRYYQNRKESEVVMRHFDKLAEEGKR